MRCPSCGEDEGKWVKHLHPVEIEDEDGDPSYFPYCANCDYGICPECEEWQG